MRLEHPHLHQHLITVPFGSARSGESHGNPNVLLRKSEQLHQGKQILKDPEHVDQQKNIHERVRSKRFAIIASYIVSAMQVTLALIMHSGVTNNKAKLEQALAETGNDVTAPKVLALKHEYQGVKGARNTLIGVSSLFMILLIPVLYDKHRSLKDDLKQLKAQENKLLLIPPPSQSMDARVLERLKMRISQDAQTLANRLNEMYDTQPAVKDTLDQMFGSREGLPSGETLEKLFGYYAYQMAQAKQTLIAPIDEISHYQKVYAFLETTIHLGELFAFMKPDQNAQSAEILNDSLLPLVDGMERCVEMETKRVKNAMHQYLSLQEQQSKLTEAMKTLARFGTVSLNTPEMEQLQKQFLESEQQCSFQGVNLDDVEGLRERFKAVVEQPIRQVREVSATLMNVPESISSHQTEAASPEFEPRQSGLKSSRHTR